MITDARYDHRDEHLESREWYKGMSEPKFQHSLAELGNSLSGNFVYPVNKRRTRNNVDKIREAEARLDAFWRAVDADMASAKAVSPYVAKVLSQRVLQRTPEYVKPSQAQPLTSTANAEHLLKPLSDLYFEREVLSERTTVSTGLDQHKSKVKTRGITASCEDIALNEPEIRSEEEDVQPTFALDKRTLKVFKTLSFVANETSQPGEVL